MAAARGKGKERKEAEQNSLAGSQTTQQISHARVCFYSTIDKGTCKVLLFVCFWFGFLFVFCFLFFVFGREVTCFVTDSWLPLLYVEEIVRKGV